MAEIITDFENNLKKLIQCYKTLVQLEKEKQVVLVNNKIREIDVITAHEEKILLEVSRLEVERLSWAEFFGQVTGKKTEDITLDDIEERCPSLQAVGDELRTIISELIDLHEINSKLLQNAINLANYMLKMLTSERQTTYENPGEKTGQSSKDKHVRFIDKSI